MVYLGVNIVVGIYVRVIVSVRLECIKLEGKEGLVMVKKEALVRVGSWGRDCTTLVRVGSCVGLNDFG